jgi:predicted GNAT family acetyltransferase
MSTDNAKKVANWDEEVTDIVPKKVDSWDEEVSDEPLKKKASSEATSFVPTPLNPTREVSTSQSGSGGLGFPKAIDDLAQKKVVEAPNKKYESGYLGEDKPDEFFADAKTRTTSGEIQLPEQKIHTNPKILTSNKDRPNKDLLALRNKQLIKLGEQSLEKLKSLEEAYKENPTQEIADEYNKEVNKVKYYDKRYKETVDQISSAPLSAEESVKNSISNIATSLQGAIPRLSLLSADIWERTLGKELAKGMYANDPFGGRDIEQVRFDAYKKLDDLAKEVKPTWGIIEGVGTLDPAIASASLVDAVSAVVSTAIPTVATGGAGLFSEMAGQSLYDFNKAKANAKGKTIEQLYQDNEAEIGVPLTIGAIAMGLEKIGLKGIEKGINTKIANGALRGFVDFSYETNKEGLTEFLQLGLDVANKSIAEGKTNEQVVDDVLNALGSKDALEVYLKGVVGSAGSIGAGKLGKSLYNIAKSPFIKNKVLQSSEKIDTLADELDNPELSKEAEQVVKETIEKEKAIIDSEVRQDLNTYFSLSEEDQRQVDFINSDVRDIEDKILVQQTALEDESLSAQTRSVIQKDILDLEAQKNLLNTDLEKYYGIKADEIRNTDNNIRPQVESPQQEINIKPIEVIAGEEQDNADGGVAKIVQGDGQGVEALKSVESTTYALGKLNETDFNKIFKLVPSDYQINVSQIGGINKSISELYHESKANNSNPQLVEAVEQLLNTKPSPIKEGEVVSESELNKKEQKIFTNSEIESIEKEINELDYIKRSGEGYEGELTSASINIQGVDINYNASELRELNDINKKFPTKEVNGTDVNWEANNKEQLKLQKTVLQRYLDSIKQPNLPQEKAVGENVEVVTPKENEALRDVESTAKALEGVDKTDVEGIANTIGETLNKKKSKIDVENNSAITSRGKQIKFRISRNTDAEIEQDFLTITAVDNNGNKVGYAKFIDNGKNNLEGSEVDVPQKYQKQGIASAIYSFVDAKGYKVKESVLQTPEGRALWKSLNRKEGSINSISEAYHAAKAKPENTRTEQEQELVKAVESLLSKEQTPSGIKEQEVKVNTPDKVQEEEVKALTKEEIQAEEEQDEMLLSGESDKRRRQGKFTKDGITYERQKETEGVEGSQDEVVFAKGVTKKFKYKVIDRSQLQPSHLGGLRNSMHFIPEAQPKRRTDSGSIAAEQTIANNPNLKIAGENTNAYSGAPVVNKRGEVIQGNNRAAGLVKAYKQGTASNYKQDLINNAEKYGMTKEQVEAMGEPVLVRELDVNDTESIELGNYEFNDIETGNVGTINPVKIVSRMTKKIKEALVREAFKGEYGTTNESIRGNFDAIEELLVRYLNVSQYQALRDSNKNPSTKGIEAVNTLLQRLVFDGGDVALSDMFEGLPPSKQNTILKAAVSIISLPTDITLLQEFQNAIVGFSNFVSRGAKSVDAWSKEYDAFTNSSPRDIYTPLELEMIRLLSEKPQSEFSKMFKDYSVLVKGKKAEGMWGEDVAPITKAEAVENIFKIKQDEQQSKESGTGSPKKISGETPKAQPTATPETKAAIDVYNRLKENNDTTTRKEYKALPESIKRVLDNIVNINKQLEQNKLITKKGNCP